MKTSEITLVIISTILATYFLCTLITTQALRTEAVRVGVGEWVKDESGEYFKWKKQP